MKRRKVLVHIYVQLVLLFLSGGAQSSPKGVSNEPKDIQLVENKQGAIWILSGKDLYRYDGAYLKHFDLELGSGTRTYSKRIFVDEDGTLWVARNINRWGESAKWAVDMNQFDQETDKFISYFIPIDQSVKSFPNLIRGKWQIIAICQDHESQIWVILDTGIYLLNPKTGVFKHLPLPITSFKDSSQPFIKAFAKGESGQMWIDTNRGLYQYQAGKFNHYYKNSITYFQNNPADSSSLSLRKMLTKRNNDLSNRQKDTSGTLWIATNGGVELFNPATGSISRVPKMDDFSQEVGWNLTTGKSIWPQHEFDVFERRVYNEHYARNENNEPANENNEPTKGNNKPTNYLVKIIFGLLLFFSFITVDVGFVHYKQLRLKAAFARQLAEVSTIALQAPMNPHFLFNSLNSINHFILKNRPKEAAKYLTKFSRLIQLILTNAKVSTISLGKELEVIRLYIQLENIRFNNQFEYNIEVQEGMDVDYFEVPPLLIQPYVENAIWHGLLPKETKGYLNLSVYARDPFLYVVIEDNGIGRQQAQELKSKSATKDKSMGMQITADRVAMLNQLKQQQGAVEIIDLADQEGNPMGTKVILTIPI